jgi:hypothetical protein
MTQKWNLQDIRRPEPSRKNKSSEIVVPQSPRSVEHRDDTEDVHVKIVDGKKKNTRAFLFAFIIFFVIVGGSFVVSTLMAGAEVTVYPRYRDPNINATIVAYKSPVPEELSYEILSFEATGERQVSATGQETVTTQAEGTIMVYNNHSTDPIRLITNTRFETAEKLLFRLKDSIIVPGYKRDESGEIVPGVVSAEVFADQAGEEYNIPPSRFTIPGFAGSPEFENVYGESVESMQGGFDGPRFVVDPAELQTAEQALRLELRNSLLTRIDTEKPAGFTHFPGAITFTYDTLPAVEYGDNLATIKERATLRIPLFKDEELAMHLAKLTIPGYERSPVRIVDTNELTFAYTSATTSSTNISAADSLEFELIGRPRIVWTYDENALKNELVGKNKTALTSVLGAYPAIERAEAETRPFYSQSFPEDPAKMTIIELLEERSE